ncbi:MAG: butyryl-CoA dehydrogenase [Bacillota bacterium]|nr:acyl-CoA dehydrogenase [Bacillota bacterium]MDI6638495.1 acyl-CoA dehydrogenase [Bacillota bacterium]MDK2930557.1 butyryl-CoA dehydrogenase [Bacillota bacterium]
MDFSLTEEQEAIRQMAAEFADKELAPHARELDAKGEYPWDNLRKLARYGYLGMMLPAEFGGSGADVLSHTLCVEEVSRACAATGVIMEIHNSLTCDGIYRFGTDEQKARYLPALARGEKIGAFALTEPGAGSDPSGIRTVAARDGNDFVINGTKHFITGAGQAHVYLLFAMTDPSKGTKGISAFIVEKGMPGLSFGPPEDKMGIRASHTGELIFSDCRIPAENLVGSEGEGYKIALTLLDGGRIGIGAQAVGIARAAFDAALRYSQERVQFGQAISGFQAIQWMLADMATEIEAARLLVYRAAYLRDKGVRCTKEVAMAKLFASEVAMRTTVKAVQIHGGYGYMREYNVERYMRDAKITEIYEGTSEIMRLLIASAVLKESKGSKER